MKLIFPVFFACLLSLQPVGAAEVKPIPPPGIEVPADIRTELEAGLVELKAILTAAENDTALPREIRSLSPDVEILHKAVDWALRYNEFFDPKQFEVAKKQLAAGLERARSLASGKAPWTRQTGLVVRGYRSRIDGSVQPYGLVIPETWNLDEKVPRRLDLWLHGRAEKLSELAFLDERMSKPGEFAPADAMVLHLYGRYCNANKFAGEVDLFEALEHAKSQYSIDEQKLVIRGFSMGGAAAWQFATHHAPLWAAAAPGAGFAETAEFFKVFAPGKTPPPWWEQVLWRWYDATLYAGNLANTKTIAYSGDKDGQKQAADIMLRFGAKEDLTFPHVIGPDTAHKYHPESKPKIDEFLSGALQQGKEGIPKKIRWTTYSLIYPKADWVTIEAMGRQWERADISAELTPEGVNISTNNIAQLRVTLPKEAFTGQEQRKLTIDGTTIDLPLWENRWQISAHKENGKWVKGMRVARSATDPTAPVLKKVGLSGPIDHAFMSPFVMVRPTGPAMNEAVGNWTKAELDHALQFWRKVFRGDAPVADDSALKEHRIRDTNLILWGDPSSNSVLKKILPMLPIKWTEKELVVGERRYEAGSHVPILIFPNPLNPERYVVINSGVTFREQALLNNSDQTPKLPDWAVVDIRTAPDARWPGLVLDAGFFDETWQLQ